jgi:type I restriction enzyme S subunit
LSSERAVVTVRELVRRGVLERPLDGNHGAIHPKPGDFVPAGIPFIMAADLVEGRVRLDTCKHITPVQASRLRKGFAREGDVLLSHKATIGRTAIVGALQTPYVVLTPQVTYYRVLNHRELDSRYLKYYFDSPDFQEFFDAWAQGGSTRAYLSIGGQLNLPVVLPPLAMQEAIAELLGALDAKIDLNRQMGGILEAMARAIFKSWFVDFDPVTARAAGRDPVGMDRDTANRFPDRFTDSVAGPLPAGWRLGSLGDVAQINARQISEAAAPSTIRYIDISAVSTGRIDAVTHYSWANAPGRARRLVRHGDTIWSCVRPNRRSYCLIRHPESDLVVSTGFAVLSPRDSAAAFTYLWTTTDDFVGYLTSHAEGSAYPAVQPDSFARASGLLPPSPVLAAFEELVDPSLELVWRTDREARTLAALRDALLPGLLSGEIRVREAEKVVGQAGA